MTTESAAWGSQLMVWLWPLVPGTASSKSGTKEARRREAGSREDSQLLPPIFISLGSVFYTPGAIPSKLSFENSRIMGVCLWKQQGHKGKELLHFRHGLPYPEPSQLLLNKQEQTLSASRVLLSYPWPLSRPGMVRVLSS